MNATRFQHLVPSSIVLVTALIVAWLSFTQEPVEAFLFPRAISVAFVLLAMWNFGQAVLTTSQAGGGLDAELLTNIAPGLFIMLAYVFFLARWLGFYTASSLVFVLLYAVYDPVPLARMEAWPKRIAITAGFMIVIYALFALLLKVQTPRGLLF
jgi:hypothetical protein